MELTVLHGIRSALTSPFMDAVMLFFTTLLIDPPTGYSFPSGHSSASFAAASVLCCMPIRRRWKMGAAVPASLVAFSRLYLCVHYPTDVVTGIILGVAFGVGVVFTYRRITTRRKVKGETDVRA